MRIVLYVYSKEGIEEFRKDLVEEAFIEGQVEESTFEAYWDNKIQDGARGVLTPGRIVVALGQTGVFHMFYQVICKFIRRHEGREITIERGKVKISIKGHTPPEEKDLLKRFAPELIEWKKTNRNK